MILIISRKEKGSSTTTNSAHPNHAEDEDLGEQDTRRIRLGETKRRVGAIVAVAFGHVGGGAVQGSRGRPIQRGQFTRYAVVSSYGEASKKLRFQAHGDGDVRPQILCFTSRVRTNAKTKKQAPEKLPKPQAFLMLQ